jgi:hypothetical protein
MSDVIAACFVVIFIATPFICFMTLIMTVVINEKLIKDSKKQHDLLLEIKLRLENRYSTDIYDNGESDEY